MPQRTIQREAIRRVFERTTRPLTTAEVLQEAKDFTKSLSLPTVYRELKRLVEGRHIRLVEISGEQPRYEKMDSPHYCHIKCMECGRVVNMDDNMDELAELLPPGYKHISHEVTFHCICQECIKD